MTGGILELAIVIAVAALLGVIVHLFKQPPFLAYIFAGIILAVFGFLGEGTSEIFEAFSSLGIMFLLFLIGMEINYSSLRLVGKTSLILGLGQILFTSVIGFAIAVFFGFSNLASLYIAIALTFSSTIIIVKLLSERKQLNSLHGKISIGFLLVQDFVAMLILIMLAGIEVTGTINYVSLFLVFIKGVGLFVLMFVLGRKFIPRLLDKIAQSLELLFLTSVAWAMGVATLVGYLGFSIEIGGFLAGIALANSSEHFQISARIRSLRDFFILIFFVLLGSSVIFSQVSTIALPIIIFSLFVLIGNPIIVIILMGLMGYRKKTSFMSGITVAQISEFSLIVVALGAKLGHVDDEVLSLVTAVGIITIIISTYVITYSEQIFKVLSKSLSIFEKDISKGKSISLGEPKPIVIVGGHRIGQNIASLLPKEDILIVDFDPDIIEYLEKEKISVLFGDIGDEEIQEQARLESAKVVVSTSPDFETNEALLIELKKYKKPPIIIVRAESERDAKHLYTGGADYVILPHLTAGQVLGKALSQNNENKFIEELKERDIKRMASSITEV